MKRLSALWEAIGRRLRRLSLRARLALGLVLVAAAGLVIADVVVYSEIESYLYGQVDQELTTAFNVVANEFNHRLAIGPFDLSPTTPAGTFGAIVGPTGVLIETPTNELLGPQPVLPSFLRAAPPSARSVTMTVGAVGDPSYQYRLLARSGRIDLLPVFGVVAIPLASLNSTLSRLVMLDLIVSAAVVAVLAAAGYAVVRFGMRPLAEIEKTAAAIAAGDLTRRVDVEDERTEIGRLGASLNDMLAQIEHAFSEQRLSEERLRQFLADASHELRTPITSIRGYSELFRRGASTRPADLASSMRRIEDEATRMGLLVDDLLLLARLDQGRPLEAKPVDLSALAAEVVADAQVVEPERELQFTARDAVVVEGDEQRLRQVVSNLVRNAFEHTPDGTPVSVSVSEENRTAVLRVSDSGPGVPLEHRERIFERFYRADQARTRERGGAGLGLSIVASIAEAHGGSARLEPSEVGGASFVVEIPASQNGARSGALEEQQIGS